SRFAALQMRPTYASPPALQDLRVRQALAYATDRQALADTLTAGQGTPADTMVLPMVEYFVDAQRAITHYPLDGRRAEELLSAAGWTRGTDGMLQGPGG